MQLTSNPLRQTRTKTRSELKQWVIQIVHEDAEMEFSSKHIAGVIVLIFYTK